MGGNSPAPANDVLTPPTHGTRHKPRWTRAPFDSAPRTWRISGPSRPLRSSGPSPTVNRWFEARAKTANDPFLSWSGFEISVERPRRFVYGGVLRRKSKGAVPCATPAHRIKLLSPQSVSTAIAFGPIRSSGHLTLAPVRRTEMRRPAKEKVARNTTPRHEGAAVSRDGSDPYQVLPPLSEDEYRALKDDIKAHGVLVPVEYDGDGNVLDGHHRVKACRELGIEEWPRIDRKFASEADKRSHARRLNLARRHLNRKEQRRLIADELRERPERSNRQIAATLGVDGKTVGAMRSAAEATAEIPHLKTTVGMDGKARASRRPQTKRPAGSAPATTMVLEPNGALLAEGCALEVRQIVVHALDRMAPGDVPKLFTALRGTINDIEKRARQRKGGVITGRAVDG